MLKRSTLAFSALALFAGGLLLAPSPAAAASRFPNILLISVDTLRADRLSSYGYHRPTSPRIDRLLAGGARLTQARTPEPLTGPAMCSTLTSLPPHVHGATRNGLHMRSGLPSLPKLLSSGGYRTAAFVGNWTLRDELTGLGDHFDVYEEVFSRKRWLGLFNSEATGEDITAASLTWVSEYRVEEKSRPFFAWVHYVEPHAPYRYWPEHGPRIGVPSEGASTKADRYDTEIAFIDQEIGRLLDGLKEAGVEGEDLLVIFTADHGESLGEHNYWGHGRNTYDPSLHVPLGFTWPGKISPGMVVRTPATLLDIPATVLGLLELAVPEGIGGEDLSGLVTGTRPPADLADRTLYFQAHRGAVHGDGGERARIRGLLEVALVQDGKKQIVRVKNDRIPRLFDLESDPEEKENQMKRGETISPELAAWLKEVREGLESLPELNDAELDEEAIEQLKALGYID